MRFPPLPAPRPCLACRRRRAPPAAGAHNSFYTRYFSVSRSPCAHALLDSPFIFLISLPFPLIAESEDEEEEEEEAAEEEEEMKIHKKAGGDKARGKADAAEGGEGEDETLVCKDCSNEFVFSAGEQAFYLEKGFDNKPVRAAFEPEQRTVGSEHCADVKCETAPPTWEGRWT